MLINCSDSPDFNTSRTTKNHIFLRKEKQANIGVGYVYSQYTKKQERAKSESKHK